MIKNKATGTNSVEVVDFTYRKVDGSVSERQGIVVSKPSDSYLVVETDSSKVTFGDQQRYLDYLNAREAIDVVLREQYGIADMPFKRFKANGISALTEQLVEI